MPNMMGTHIKKEEKWPCKRKTESNANTTKNKPCKNNTNNINSKESHIDKTEATTSSAGKIVFITA